MIKNIKLITLLKRLDQVLSESSDIFFEERPYLENPQLPHEILDLKEKRENNERAIQITIEEIEKVSKSDHEGDSLPVEPPEPEQEEMNL